MLPRFSFSLCRNISTIKNRSNKKLNQLLSLSIRNLSYSCSYHSLPLCRDSNLKSPYSTSTRTEMTADSSSESKTSVVEFSVYETLAISYNPKTHVATVSLNRPDKANAMNGAFWRECAKCFEEVGNHSDIRCIIVNGNGKHFTAGLDLSDPGFDMTTLHGDQESEESDDGDGNGKEREVKDVARKAFQLKKMVDGMQACFTAIEKCPQPVIAAVSGACVGAGIDLITACDIRICDVKSIFSIKEVQIGLAADVGTLQRIPKVIGNHSLMRELAYTGRNFNAEECQKLGLVSEILENKDQVMERAQSLAEEIASQSPVAVYGTKINLNYARDHSVSDSLDYITTWNMAALQSVDILKAGMAQMSKKKATFSKL